MKKKVLLMGRSGAGKTSMRSIIFANYIARDTHRLGATLDVEYCNVRFLGNLVLNLWDCGGQTAFMAKFMNTQRDTIYRSVEALIYVFAINVLDDTNELFQDMQNYSQCLNNLQQYSPNSKVFCLIHKMDMVKPEERRQQKFEDTKQQIERYSNTGGFQPHYFATTIWDESLYKAWSDIVCQLMPNISTLRKNLATFAEYIDADEVLMFEKATFLAISSCERKPHNDRYRFEKISTIVKQFKLSCTKMGTNFSSLEVRNAQFAAFIEEFTSNTYVMVVQSDSSLPSALTLMNIRSARAFFENW